MELLGEELAMVATLGEEQGRTATLEHAPWMPGRALELHRSDSYTVAVRLVDDPDTARWLEELAGPVGLEWDRGNRTKSEVKHSFAEADVESIFANPMLFAGRIVEPVSGETRYLLLGVTADGRYAALVFTRRGEKLRPISCRAMRRKEKEQYDAAS